MNRKIRLLIIISLTLFSLSLISFPSFATDAEPSLTIHTYNLSYSESIYLAYAVKSDNLDMTEHPVKMLFWNSPADSYDVDTAEYTSSASDITDVKGVLSTIIYSNGIAPKNLTDIVYSRAYAEVDGKIVYSDVIKFSPLQYLYELREHPNASQDQKEMCETLLKYGALAQKLLKHDTERLADQTFYKITVSGGTLSDGFAHGLYTNGDTIKLSCTVPENMTFSHWEDSSGNNVGTTQTLELKTPEKDEEYTPVFAPIAVLSKFNVTFKDADGNTIDTQVVEEGSSATAPEAPAKKCYEFTGWDKAFDNITEDTVITAVYTENHAYVDSQCTGCGKYKESNTNAFEFTDLGDSYSIKLKNIIYPKIIVIPETHNGKPITAIQPADNPLNINTLEKLVLSKNLEIIGYKAFNSCQNLTEIIIFEGSNLKTIDAQAFTSCSNLAKIVIPKTSKLETIGTSAFAQTAIKEISIPEGVTVIGETAFYGCKSLTTVSLPSSLTIIDKRAFGNCSALSTVNYPVECNWYFKDDNNTILSKDPKTAATQLTDKNNINYILEKK